MKVITLDENKEKRMIFNKIKTKFWSKINSIINIHTIIIINIIINGYLLRDNIRHNIIIKDILVFKNKIELKNNTFKNEYPGNDKELIGLYYPEINYEKIKEKLKQFNIIGSIIDLINQLENKLIFLEKEINLTKIVSFYNSRTTFLKENNIKYDERNLGELHEIVNWIIIHKSNQLKGIASDKYLACKYVKLKIGTNLCEQRIAVYDRFEQINITEYIKNDSIALKISNSCWKTVFIDYNSSIEVINEKMNIFKKLLESDHGLSEQQFFHLYAKKRIIIERQFIPRTDLYEFKYLIVNKNIKFIYFYYITTQQNFFIYDKNYNFLFKEKINKDPPLNLKAIFKNETLKQMEDYAIELSKDFPYFIRVDLYCFHEKIYLSELTYASINGIPLHRNETFVKEAAKGFSFIDYYD